jgi:hypothetical protein
VDLENGFDLETMEVAGKYDTIIVYSILHHLRQWREVVWKLKKNSRKNTVFYICEPLSNWLLNVARRAYKRINRDYDRDQFYFRRGELAEELERQGFMIRRRQVSGDIIPLCIDARFIKTYEFICCSPEKVKK